MTLTLIQDRPVPFAEKFPFSSKSPFHGRICAAAPPLPRRLSHASSLRSTSSSNSSSFASSSSSSSSFYSCSSRTSQLCASDIIEEKEEVYVSSSSCILIGQKEDNLYDVTYSPSYYNSSASCSSAASNAYDSAKMRSIFYDNDKNESQEISCFLEGAESDDDQAPSGDNYESIYEVISPEEDEAEVSPRLVGGLQTPDDDFDDEVDSEDAYCSPQVPEERGEAPSGYLRETTSPAGWDEYGRHRSPSGGLYGNRMNKLAVAANQGMKIIKKNWSLTKSEVKTGISRIKKKSTFSTPDIFGGEDFARDSPSPSDDKRKWSFKSHFRRKSLSSLSILRDAAARKDTATFYLTLTIEAEHKDKLEALAASRGQPEASPSFKEEVLTSSTSSLASLATSASQGTSSRPASVCSTSSGRKGTHSCPVPPVRPKTAPPAPPTEKTRLLDPPEEDHSKEKVAQRLNEILSAAPASRPGRRILKSFGSSEPEAPQGLPPTAEDAQQGSGGGRPSPSVKYATVCLERGSPEVVLGALCRNEPQTRLSALSAASSESYIRPADIASCPPPLPSRLAPAFPSSPTLLGPARASPVLSARPPVFPEGESPQHYLETASDALGEEEPLYVSSHFADEPLYQFYTATVNERAALSQSQYSSEDDYEVISEVNGTKNESLKSEEDQGGGGPEFPSRPSAMELVTPADGKRTLWCELPEVIESGILDRISNQEKKLQEAMFEVVTSEASYLKSLNVLVTHFLQSPEFSQDGEDCILQKRERKVLFSDILSVKRCSELLLADLEGRWQESFYISNIADIILKHTQTNFKVYVKYCSNQIYQDRILNELKNNNPKFVEALNRLEESSVCQSLAMQSFLMLPMQRITRLPLLIDAIYHRLKDGSPEWQECKLALASLTKIVAECNEGARRMERMEEMLIISRQLDFKEVRALPLISASRWLVKKGELVRLTIRETDTKLTFAKKISKQYLFFFLFTDLLMVTKRKSDGQYTVLDYCPRNMVQVVELGSVEKFPLKFLEGHKNLLIMTMLQNHENKTVELVLSCSSESDRTRWIEAVTPRTSENPDETIYEEWDCPQVQVIRPYVGKQPDELSLEVSDVINVLKKMSDGWYQGERLRDGERGWFPGNHCFEIASAHVRARNLRWRYRLLAISGSFLEELDREKERFEREKKKERRKTLTLKKDPS